MQKKFAIIAVMAFTVISCNTTKKAGGNNMQDQTSASQITNTTWELIKLEGTNIEQSNEKGEKIQFTLNSVDQMVFGNSGCNSFNGSYELDDGNRIKFSKIASTRMACPESDINEQEVLDVFNQADNYTIDGNKLILNVGKRALWLFLKG